MGEYMEAQMDRQIEGAISTNEALCEENALLNEMLKWAYGKLYERSFSNMDDALMADRIKLWLEHGIAL